MIQIRKLCLALALLAINVQAATEHWTPKLYTYCMDMADARKRTVPEQAQLLKELGFDGAGFGLWLDAKCEQNLKIFDDAGLQVFMFHTFIKYGTNGFTLDPRMPDTIRKLKGRPVTLCTLLSGLKPGDPKGMDSAVKLLREMGDLAQASGIRISVYHHLNDWTETLPFAIEVMKQVNHPAVGFNFNLYHWLRVTGTEEYKTLLKENAAKLFGVVICGAQVGTKTWTNGLIQPLDQGDFDNRKLVDYLNEIGYRGPVGLMCFGIPGDARPHLERSMKVWKSWQ
ncbi:MAG: TIM barrel protein [Verrucomicrobiota bacterium]